MNGNGPVPEALAELEVPPETERVVQRDVFVLVREDASA